MHLHIEKWDLYYGILIYGHKFVKVLFLWLIIPINKILHRLYITQYLCSMWSWYRHSLWYYTPDQKSWSGVIEKLHMVLNIEIPLSPSCCLLGLCLEMDVKLVYIALILAKKAVLQHCKTKHSLNMNHWLNVSLDHMVMERMSMRSYLGLCSALIHCFGLEWLMHAWMLFSFFFHVKIIRYSENLWLKLELYIPSFMQFMYY